MNPAPARKPRPDGDNRWQYSEGQSQRSRAHRDLPARPSDLNSDAGSPGSHKCLAYAIRKKRLSRNPPDGLPGWTVRLLGRWYEGDLGMDISSLVALAGNTLVAAAVTDAWETARHGFDRLFGRGKPDPATERRLEATRGQLVAAAPADLERVQADLASQWALRLSDLLEEDRTSRPSCVPWWRRSGRCCPLVRSLRRATRSPPGEMSTSARIAGAWRRG
jgi:hypothetical protein